MIVQLCQHVYRGTKCRRLAKRWIRIEYDSAGSPDAKFSKTWAVCDAHADDERKVEDLGPVEVTRRAS